MDALKHVNLHQSIKDAILQPGIYSTAVAPFIDCGGTQSDATRLLSESYVGIPSMVKAAADSAQLIGVDCQTILRDTIKQTLLENFDPERVDATLVTAEVRVSKECGCSIYHELNKCIISGTSTHALVGYSC